MKKLILLFLLLAGCQTYKANVISQRLMNDYGVVSAISYEHGYYTVYWACSDPRWKKQPCIGISDHPLKIGIVVGDTLEIVSR